MTHKIPHNSDTIFLIKPCIWFLKKKRRRKKEDKTIVVAVSSKAVVHEANSIEWYQHKADLHAQTLCRQGAERQALHPVTNNLPCCMLGLTQMFA